MVPPDWSWPVAAVTTAVALSAVIWLSDDGGPSWRYIPVLELLSPAAATNVFLIMLLGVAVGLQQRQLQPRLPLPLRARSLVYYTWLLINLWWFIAGIYQRDFRRKPKWLSRAPPLPNAAHQYGPATMAALRVSYNVGMAAAWPTVANLAVLLLPVDRTALVLGLAGGAHEEGVLAHALAGSAMWIWASVHALLCQAPMLAAGLWRVIMLPAADGSTGKGVSNCMGLAAWLCLCALGLTSLAPFRRRFFNAFQQLHLALFGAVLLLAALHEHKVFWYGMLGAVLYTADVAQRWVLRRRAAAATATLYPRVTAEAPAAAALAPQNLVGPRATAAAARVLAAGGGGGGGKFVALHVETGGPPGCSAGQHVWIRVPAVSPSEWHPYSVASIGPAGFSLLAKAGGDWEARLAAAVEAAGGEAVPLELHYEGPYGGAHLASAAAAADCLLLLAGGAGVTPLAAALQGLLAAAAEGDSAREARGEQGGWEGRPPRVRLVWAVTQQSDTQPLAPLLRAAAARGWPVHVHCTRRGPGGQEGAEGPPGHAAGPGAGAGAAPASKAEDALYMQAPAGLSPSPRYSPTKPAQGHAGGAKGALRAGAPCARAAAAPPWQPTALACWALLAAAAAAAAAGRLLGGAAAYSYDCRLRNPKSVLSEGGPTAEEVASYRAAFMREWADTGGAARCPAAFAPLDIAGPEALRAGGFSLHVCRVWGMRSPELCVKCDPFVTRGSFEALWPCCGAPACFFAVHLAPLAGWLAGAVAGAAVGCWVWRLAAARRRRARPLAVGRAAAAGRRRNGTGGDAGRQEEAPLITDAAGPCLAHANGIGGGWGGLGATDPLGGLKDAERGEGGSGLGGVSIATGRPDVDAYVRDAVAALGASGGRARRFSSSFGGGTQGGGKQGGPVVGVVVCGPESLAAAARDSYERHVGAALPGSWFRGFSFTT